MTSGWISLAYDIVALTGVFLAVYVMQKTEHDRINRVDPMMLQWFRRLAFIACALALCYSIISEDWQRSVAVLLMVGAADINLAVNALALHMRGPPYGGRMVRSIESISYVVRKPRQ